MVRTARNGRKGWHNESKRHSLASQGVSTSVKDNSSSQVKLMKSKIERFDSFDYSYVDDKPYQIVDSKTGKHYYYKTKEGRDKALIKKSKKKIVIKDWKKGSYIKGDGWNKFGDSEKGFVYITDKYNTKNNNYCVEVYKNYFGGVTEKPNITKYFNSESLALKYAKNYMEEH